MSNVLHYGEAANQRHLYTEAIDENGNAYLVRKTDTGAKFDQYGSLVTIPVEHHRIHNGSHFFRTKTVAIPALGTYQLVVDTGISRPHLFFNIDQTDGAINYNVKEGITSYTSGTEIILFNNNRNAPTQAVTKWYDGSLGLTVGTSFVEIINHRVGLGETPSSAASGATRMDSEYVLKNDTLYLCTFTNLMNKVNNVTFTISMYQTDNV